MKQRRRIYYDAEQRNLMWDRWQKGDSMHAIHRFRASCRIRVGYVHDNEVDQDWCLRFVAKKLEQRWSPEQIAGWLKKAYPEDENYQVSHEIIYCSLYVQARGALKKELIKHLRTRRSMRRSRHRRNYRANFQRNLMNVLRRSIETTRGKRPLAFRTSEAAFISTLSK